jgi:hypothetical protein
MQPSLYWRCQLSGWLLYVLIMIFYVKVFFGFPVPNAFYQGIWITGFCGLVVTHILRLVLTKLGLRPPIRRRKVLVLLLIVFNIIALFSLADAATVGWLGLSDQGSGSIPLGRRFVFNIYFNGALVPIWVMFYYLWHFAKLYRQPRPVGPVTREVQHPTANSQ